MRKVVLVTGAGSGIGRSITIGLLKSGCSVILAGRREEALKETVDQANVADTLALIVPTDVSNKNSVEHLFDKTIKKFGRLDILFNNAGVNLKDLPLEEISLEEWNRVVGVNLTGPFLCTQEAIRIMKKQSPQGGRIINNGSISSHVPRPHATPYNVTKAGITNLTKSTQLEGRYCNIVCSQIDIGNVATEMTVKMGKGVIQADGSVKKEPTFDMQHLVDAFLYLADLPLSVNVPFMTIMANGMPYIGRG